MTSRLGPLALGVLLGCGGETQPPPLGVQGGDAALGDSQSEGSTPVTPIPPRRGPSCAASSPGASSDCGASGGDSCCAVDLIPGGSFFRLDDRGAGSRASFGTEYPATVSAFWLDRYEITVGRFRQFLGAYATWRPKPGDGANPHVPGSGWQATWTLPATVGDLSQSLAGLACDSGWAPTNVYWWTAAPGPSEHKPIACATWYELFAFCAWDGGRLPTLAEWEFAASGGPEQRVFPWSSPPESTVVDETYAVYSPSSNTPRPGAEDVGTHPRGAARWGTMDLGGNVFEAFLDSTTPPDPSASGACRDCALYGPGSTYFAFQGGAWPGDPTWMDNVAVDISAPARTSRVPSIGARCVHDP